jgi:hypothetical protein
MLKDKDLEFANSIRAISARFQQKNVIPVQGVSFCPLLGRWEKGETFAIARRCFST